MANPPRRHQPSPIRLSASPVSNRLEIGAVARTLPFPAHVPSKSNTAQPWGSNEPSSSGAGHHGQRLSSTRPLPIIPNSVSGSFKAGLSSSPSSSGSLVSFQSASPIVFPSTSGSAIIGSPRYPLPTPPGHPSTIPVPVRQSGSLDRSRQASTPTTASAISTLSSKVLITQQQRGQPLFVDMPSDTSTPTSSLPKQSSDSTFAPSAIRPLPRVPHSSLTFGLPSSIITSSNFTHTPLKRPRTSPSSFSVFSGLTSSSVINPRSAFDNIPSSWVSKPSGLSSSRPSSVGMLRTPTTMHPLRPPALKLSRARSLSWTKRERSLDSRTSRTPPGNGTRSLTFERYSYQGLPGTRPSTKNRNVTPTIIGRQRERGHSLSAWDPGYAAGRGSSHHASSPPSSSLTRNPPMRHVRPQCPSGPVVRGKSVRATPTTSAGTPSPGRFNPSSSAFPSTSMPNVPTVQTPDSIRDTDIPPLKCENDELILSPESPLEFFVDGPETDVTSINRSPSPILYALPPDNNELSDWHSINDEGTDDDLGAVSASTSNSRGFAVGRRRTQLRSYQMDYRPRDDTIQDLPKPPRALPVPPKATSREKKKGKETKKWSFGDFTSLSSPSTPGTGTSSPERKGRSRQSRRLAEAVSLALGSGIRASHSSSGRGSVSAPSQPPLLAGLSTSTSSGGDVPVEDEVLDIRMPSIDGDGPRTNRSSSPVPLDFQIHESMSTLRADMVSSDRSPVPRNGSRSESSRSDVHWVTKEGKQSGLRDSTPVESRLIFCSHLEDDDDYESKDMPFMSRDRPPEHPTPFIPPPPQRSFHTLSDSVGDDQQAEVVESSDFPLSQEHKSQTLSREKFPVRYAPLPPLPTSLVYPTNRGGKKNEVDREQPTTSGPSRSTPTGGNRSRPSISTIESDPNADRKVRRLEASEADDDDIYCDEEPRKISELDKHSEEVVNKSKLVGGHS